MREKGILMMLHRCMGLTFRRFQLLESWCNGDWEVILQASLQDLQLSGLDRKGLEKWFVAKHTSSPEKELSLLHACSAEVIVYGDENYPVLLGSLHTPPVLLFVRGSLMPEDSPGLAVVGSRKISEYGKRALQHFLPPCIEAGVCIVSGLALGVDIHAHSLAYKHGGRTLCVLGGGIDQISPRSNQRFAHQLIHENRGAVLSEYLPGVEPRPEFFPVRNRIIAGLSKAVLVIEATKKSGSLITARLANEQGKDVLSVPGDIFTSHSSGTNHIIESGEAQSISNPEIVLQLFGKSEGMKKLSLQSLQGKELDIMRVFKKQEKLHINEILRETDQTNQEVLSVLSLLEMKGYVQHIGAQTYVSI